MPPTFMSRNWSHCHSRHISKLKAHVVGRAETVFASWGGAPAYGRGSSSGRRRCGHQGCGGWTSSRGRGRCQRGPRSRSGSSGCSQSIPRGLLSAEQPQSTPDAQGCRGPYLVRRLRLQLVEYLDRLLLRRQRGHGCDSESPHTVVAKVRAGDVADEDRVSDPFVREPGVCAVWGRSAEAGSRVERARKRGERRREFRRICGTRVKWHEIHANPNLVGWNSARAVKSLGCCRQWMEPGKLRRYLLACTYFRPPGFGQSSRASTHHRRLPQRDPALGATRFRVRAVASWRHP